MQALTNICRTSCMRSRAQAKLTKPRRSWRKLPSSLLILLPLLIRSDYRWALEPSAVRKLMVHFEALAHLSFRRAALHQGGIYCLQTTLLCRIANSVLLPQNRALEVSHSNFNTND